MWRRWPTFDKISGLKLSGSPSAGMIRPDQVSPPGVNSIKLFYSPGQLYWAFPFSKGFLDKHTSLFAQSVSDEEKKVLKHRHQMSIAQNFFPSLLMTRPSKLECLYLAITFQSFLTFVGNTRSLPKKDASERRSNWVGSGLALKF